MKKNILKILVIAMCVFLFSGIYAYAEESSSNEMIAYSGVGETVGTDETEGTDETDDTDEIENIDEKEDADETEDDDETEDTDEIEDTDEKEDGDETEDADETEETDEPEETDGLEDADETVDDAAAGKRVENYRTVARQMTATDYVQSYVERCYQYILGRSVDASGLNTWTKKILSGYGGAEIVKDLIISDEFKAKGKTDAEVVEILYQAMLDRNADSSGKADWLNRLSDGVSYRYIINGFAGSQEFKNICASYGIDAGKVEITEARDQNIGVTGFVMRNYRKILGRDADVSGLNTWTQKILSGHGGAEIVKDLVYSDEFKAKKKPNEEFVEILYQAMLSRNADSSGKADWVNCLSDGASYRYIINGFTGSQEFKKICASYGIEAGKVEITEARDRNIGVTGFVMRNYRKVLGRDADIDGLNNWCNQILSGAMTPAQVAYGFVFSEEIINKNLSNAQYTEMLYGAMLGRSSDASGKNDWVTKLNKGMTREEVFWGFANSDEFAEILASYGLGESKKLTVKSITAKFNLLGNSGVQFQFVASLSGKPGSADNNYYIMQVENYTNNIVGEPIASVTKASTISYTNNNLDQSKLKEIAMHKVVLAVKLGDRSYKAVTDPINVSNIEAVAGNTVAIYKGASKKGLQGVYYANYLGNGSDIVDARSSNTKQTLINLDLATVVSTSPKSGYRAYTYKGNTYYFSELTDLKANVRSLNSGYQQYLYGNNGTTPVCVSLCLLLSYNPDNSYLIDPAARIQGHSYYMLNVREDRARETFEALFLYLGEIFGQKDCYVTNWILGNEINSSKAWNYSGNLDFDTYMECYTTAFRLLYSGVKTQKTGNTVSISLDNGWTAAPDTYAGKTTLDVFAQKINAQNPNISWSIAYHPYSYPLTRADFWNDYSNTTDSLSTKYISMRNIKVLTDYAGVLESAYGKVSETIRVLLTEQGYSYHAGAELQAQAITRGYYIAEFNDRIDAFIIRAVADDTGEMSGGLYLGLMNTQHDKRISFYVYEYMDSDIDQFCNVSASGTVSKENYTDFNKAKEIVCNTNWSSIVSGFNKTKLAAIK